MDVESLKKIKQMTEKNIMELGKKNELSPTETKALKDGSDVLEWLDYQIEKCEMKENGYSQYSGHEAVYATPRRYNITSYRQPHGRMSYGMPVYYAEDGRSYTGMPGYMETAPMYYRDGGYSRHSINDRAVACLEQMMDETGSDYERQQVHKFIEMIRSAE